MTTIEQRLKTYVQSFTPLHMFMAIQKSSTVHAQTGGQMPTKDKGGGIMPTT